MAGLVHFSIDMALIILEDDTNGTQDYVGSKFSNVELFSGHSRIKSRKDNKRLKEKYLHYNIFSPPSFNIADKRARLTKRYLLIYTRDSLPPLYNHPLPYEVFIISYAVLL